MKRVAVCIKPQQFNNSEGYSIWRNFPVGIVGIKSLNYASMIKYTYNVELVAIIMAPMKYYSGMAGLKMYGFSKIVFISDPKISGSDSLGTSKVLANAIEKYECNVVIMGKSSEDSCTGQVPIQLSMALGAHYFCDSEVEFSTIKANNKVVISVENNYPEEFPSLHTIQDGLKSIIETVSLADLGLSNEKLRYTDVIAVSNTKMKDGDAQITEMDASEVANYIQEVIKIEER